MKKLLIALLIAALSLTLAACVKVNINTEPVDTDQIMAESALTADPAAYSTEGKYEITFRYEPGGMAEADMSRAYVAYYPTTVTDVVDAITGGEDDGIPELPADAQEAVAEAEGADELQHIAVIVVETVDDTTLRVSFTDDEQPLQGRTYWFIIPNLGIGGSVTPE